jgi:quercetin dioxygenase-like cupin family protein
MEIEMLNTKTRLHKDKRTRKFSNYKFDLPALIENMKHSHAWAKGELISMVLQNKPESQILLTALHEGTEIDSFHSKDSISLQIIEGKLICHCLGESVILKKDQIHTLNKNVEYSLIAMEETVFLLTISNNTIIMVEN